MDDEDLKTMLEPEMLEKQVDRFDRTMRLMKTREGSMASSSRNRKKTVAVEVQEAMENDLPLPIPKYDEGYVPVR